jgi:hypothetical protein
VDELIFAFGRFSHDPGSGLAGGFFEWKQGIAGNVL